MQYRVKERGTSHQATTNNLYFAYFVAKKASQKSENVFTICQKSGGRWILLDTYKDGRKVKLQAHQRRDT